MADTTTEITLDKNRLYTVENKDVLDLHHHTYVGYFGDSTEEIIERIREDDYHDLLALVYTTSGDPTKVFCYAPYVGDNYSYFYLLRTFESYQPEGEPVDISGVVTFNASTNCYEDISTTLEEHDDDDGTMNLKTVEIVRRLNADRIYRVPGKTPNATQAILDEVCERIPDTGYLAVYAGTTLNELLDNFAKDDRMEFTGMRDGKFTARDIKFDPYVCHTYFSGITYLAIVDDVERITRNTQETEENKMTTAKEPYTYATRDRARAYIGKRGYFANSMVEFNARYKYSRGEYELEVLNSVVDDDVLCFKVVSVHGTQMNYGFFMPADESTLVKKPEYRAYTLDEFLKDYKLGESIIHMRPNERSVYSYKEKYGVFISYQIEKTGDSRINFRVNIGGVTYDSIELVNTFEVFNHRVNEWTPFGVLVK